MASVSGRLNVVSEGMYFDVAQLSGGRYGPSIESAFEDWVGFREWYEGATLRDPREVDERDIGPPVARPRQVFGIGLNYRDHAMESGLEIPRAPMVFTKFPSCVTGPFGEVGIPTPQTDWEVELAVVMGAKARNVSRESAWTFVAGLTGAQDFSARDVQLDAQLTPQFSLGKSFPRFLPLGPLLVTADEFNDRDAIRVSCAVDGEVVQSARTDDLIFPIDFIVAYLSSIVTLYPGDVILTGTPAGVGFGRSPRRFLQPGNLVETEVEHVGRMRHLMVEEPWNWASQ
jgi:2-keto-4-pentenoate hydratase/2-oxohepta-3-ene-1,7-dioic acid hydratase in catechol pathway